MRLSRIEFELFAKLARDPTRVFTKPELRRAIGSEQTGERTLDSHACRLRKRLAERGAQLVTNRWGTGYALINADWPVTHTQTRRRDARRAAVTTRMGSPCCPC